MSVLGDIKPENVFRYFEEISRIPRGSYHTKAIAGYLEAFARGHGLVHYRDAADNVIIIKDASSGYQDAPSVILQGHTDMVCEKEAGCTIDFEKEGLDLYVDGEFLKAHGTTLGADDGIAVAYMLAILDDGELAHPRLEAVFTSNEEVGLLGAKEIDLSMLKGKILLNIDSDIEGHFLTSCAGGLTAQTDIPVSYEKRQGVGVAVRLHGLLGGHSGSEIDKEHANAIVELGRVLKYIEQRVPMGIAELKGGLKDNAIPREAECTLVIRQQDQDLFFAAVSEVAGNLQKEYQAADPGLLVSTQTLSESEYEVLNPVSAQKVLFFLRNMPNGVMHMSTVINGLVETSLNAGIMQLGKKSFQVSASVRSSVGSRKEEVMDKLAYLAEFLGGTAVAEGDYPAWEYCADSKIRGKITEVYKKLFEKEPVFEAIHAGLECGMFCGKIEGLDAVSFGPDNFDIHTPMERLSIPSAGRIYQFLTELLRGIK